MEKFGERVAGGNRERERERNRNYVWNREKIHIESNASGQFVEATFDRRSKQKTLDARNESIAATCSMRLAFQSVVMFFLGSYEEHTKSPSLLGLIFGILQQREC